MDKRYQVFVSSTYADLKEERSKVIQTLMEMDCIPSGMELFPAADEEQMQFIKKIIDDCDYYVLIIGGRYGSTSPEGISYTEQEYDYAVNKSLKVVAFIHKNLDGLPMIKSEGNPEARERLRAFREKVQSGRLVKFWTSAEELPGLVSLSLSKTIKTHPAIGWVRGNQVATTELLSEINELRKRNQELETAIQALQDAQGAATDHLAGLDDTFVIHFLLYEESETQPQPFSWSASWRNIFMLVATSIIRHGSANKVMDSVSDYIKDISHLKYMHMVRTDEATIPIHLSALGLINIAIQPNGSLLTLTSRGLKLLTETGAVKKGQISV